MPARGSIRKMCASGAASAASAHREMQSTDRTARRLRGTSDRGRVIEARLRLRARDDLDDGGVTAEADSVSVAKIAPSIEAEVLIVHEGPVRRARVFELDPPDTS